MAVATSNWTEGFVKDCRVTFMTDNPHQGPVRADVDFIIELDGETIAEGNCWVPADFAQNFTGHPVTRRVRFEAVAHAPGKIAICATDIGFSDGWLSDQKLAEEDEDVLQAHSL